jgi:FtsP/CotA-like multicopper oxidase with cupredoxin domain
MDPNSVAMARQLLRCVSDQSSPLCVAPLLFWSCYLINIKPALVAILFASLAPAAGAAPAAHPALVTPIEYRSANGVLAVTMEARPTQVVGGGQTIAGATYNGVYGGPVLRLHPGDTLWLHLVNHLPQATNSASAPLWRS